jgi:membrane protein implicated in regulation of membrane protease activity
MDPWIWLGLMVVFALIELACSFNLVTIWFAISAFIMIFVSSLTGSLKIDLAIFLILAIVLLVFTRPIAVRKLKVGKVKTNVDDLIGRDAIVTKEIAQYGKGEVKIRGLIWTAISDTNEEIAKDTICIVVRIEGVKAVVRRKI